MNHDGLFTITDVGMIGKALFFWPGNTLIEVASRSDQLRTFLEIGPGLCNGILAGAISAPLWLFVVLWLFIVTGK